MQYLIVAIANRDYCTAQALTLMSDVTLYDTMQMNRMPTMLPSQYEVSFVLIGATPGPGVVIYCALSLLLFSVGCWELGVGRGLGVDC